MKEPNIPNRKELLEQLRDNNCRELLTREINISVGERSKIKATDPELVQIHTFIQQQKQMIENLKRGIEIIDEKLNEIHAGK